MLITPNNFSSGLTHIISLPTIANRYSWILPDMRKWHLSSFNFMKLFSNHIMALIVSFSNLWKTCSNFLSKQIMLCRRQNYTFFNFEKNIIYVNVEEQWPKYGPLWYPCQQFLPITEVCVDLSALPAFGQIIQQNSQMSNVNWILHEK